MRSPVCFPRSVRRWSLPTVSTPHALLALLLPAVIATVSCGGCGSSNRTIALPSPSPSASPGTVLLEGNAAHRAAILAGYQSFAAGVAYPLTALEVASPSGSAIKTGGSTSTTRSSSTISTSALTFARLSATLNKARSATGRSATRQTNSSLSYVSSLNLYAADPAFSGNSIVLSFYTDVAGTQSAGGMTMTLPTGFNANNANTDYTSYPVKITLNVNLTAGNLPCNGTIFINFADASGKNTLTGSLTLPKSPVTFNIDLALDESLNVSGTITGQENGATIRLTNCSGSLFGTLNCDLEIDPYGWKGTASGSFVTGQFTTMVDTSNGTCTSTVDAQGNVDIVYPDKTTETITNPLVASLISGSGTIGTGTPTPSPTPTPTPSPTPTPTPSPTTAYNAPIDLGAVNPVAINTSGQILALRASDFVPLFLSSATATPVVLNGGYGATFTYSSYVGLAMNDSGQIIESALQVPALYWSSPTATGQSLAGSGTTEAFAINNAGVIAGDVVGTYSHTPTIWNGPNSPVSLATVPNYSYHDVLGLNAAGQFVGYADNGNAVAPIYWASSTAQPQLLATPAGYTGTVSEMSLNASGQIFATVRISGYGSDADVYYWSSPTATGQLLPTLDASSRGMAFGINASGVIVGRSGGDAAPTTSQASSSSVAVEWQNGKVTDLNTQIPTGTNWTLNSATAINDNGDIVGIGSNANVGAVGSTSLHAFLLTPTGIASRSATVKTSPARAVAVTSHR